MAEIRPFRGVLYDPARVGDVTAVVAPPYDVIGPAEQTALYERHPCNVVRLELGQEHSGNGRQDNRYTRAKQFLEEWLRGGVLRRDGRPAIYLYAVEYRLPSGAVRTMRGFLSLVKLEEFGTGRIFPHENTRAAAKDDRYQLLETCRSNFSPIFSLYSDPAGDIIRTLESADIGRPCIAVTDSDGSHHRLWTVTDPAALERVVAALEPLPLFLGAGYGCARDGTRRPRRVPLRPAHAQSDGPVTPGSVRTRTAGCFHPSAIGLSVGAAADTPRRGTSGLYKG